MTPQSSSLRCLNLTEVPVQAMSAEKTLVTPDLFPWGLSKRGRPKKPNALVFTWGMLPEMRPGERETPKAYIRRLFETCYTNEALKRLSDVDLARIIQHDGPFQFNLNNPTKTIDVELLRELKSADPADFEKVAVAFRNLVRGFTDQQLSSEVNAVRIESKQQLAKLRKLEKEFLSREKLSKKTGYFAIGERYKAGAEDTAQLIQAHKARNKTAVARWNLQDQTTRRRYGNIALLTPKTQIALQIEGLEPDLIDFPLRHLTWLPVTAYRGLAKQWGTNRDKTKIVLLLENVVFSHGFFDQVDKLVQNPIFGFSPERLTIFDELRSNATGARWHSTGLIAVTQTEGTLWAYARFLQKNGTPVYKVFKGLRKHKYSLYRWDGKTKSYRDRYTNGRPKHNVNRRGDIQFAVSGRDLVTDSVIQEIISPELFTYLLDEFFDSRNDLAHGNLVITKVLAVQALLCLYSVLFHAVEHSKSNA